MKRSSKPPGGIIERLLWGSRLLVLVAVVAGVVLAVGAACLATVDAVYFIGNLLRYADPGLGYEARDELRVELVTIIVKILDSYLISAILIVFSLGLYELFVGRVDAAEGSETASRLLYVRSIDDLKNKVVKLILLILAMESSNAPYTCATIAHSNSSTARAASCSSAGLST
ncbi:MAG TPA: YqhA family protein [Rubrobacteraceae bacterium]|nr:YqhA family protein [Rubrobacteraceae bacterium]